MTKRLNWHAVMRPVRNVGQDFFPLDEELALLPGSLTPSLQETVVRLGARMPFCEVVQELTFLKQVTTTEATIRRHTETAGAAYVALQTEEVEQVERTLPAVSEGAKRQLMSTDGAMVPLVHGEWAEVKTVAIGAIQPPVLDAKRGETVVHTIQLSYFSRLADAETFTRLATVETQRRGTERAETVCAVNDGAEWIQGFIDVQRHDAVRILDFSHAASYVAQVGQAVLGEATAEFNAWLATTLHELKHDSPDQVMQTLRDMQRELEGGAASPETLDAVRAAVPYLDKRRPQMDSARFQAAGYPIGSGSVESGNKVVVEARMKGAGMHWTREHVNPLIALRDVLCSARWEQDWSQIATRVRADHLKARQQRQRVRWTQRRVVATASASVNPMGAAPPEPSELESVKVTTSKRPVSPSHHVKSPYRPPVNHPWRHSPIGRARFKSYRYGHEPKV
jgi:hypothetical protein